MTPRVNGKLREQWLLEAADAIRPRIEDVTGAETPAYRVSVGFPSRGALSSARRRIGECWVSMVSVDKVSEMFISPTIADPMEVGATLAHELIHCNDECKNKHNARFAKVAAGIGLAGKPTATVAGTEFIEFFTPILKKLGPYPHGGMVVNANRKVQGTRMLKVICANCGYTARTTRVWLESMGAPLCPCNQEPMEVA